MFSLYSVLPVTDIEVAVYPINTREHVIDIKDLGIQRSLFVGMQQVKPTHFSRTEFQMNRAGKTVIFHKPLMQESYSLSFSLLIPYFLVVSSHDEEA
jgi:hypothetical protein